MNLGTFILPSTPVVMGVLNLAPESFCDGMAFTTVESAVARGEQMVLEGAAIIDVNAESTLPGTEKTSVQQEIDRITPVIEILSKRIAVPISINTSNPEVMQAAVIAGAKMLNDIRALSKVGALGMASKLKVPVCIMHMLNEPGTMQLKPQFDDIVTEVYQFLERRITSCVESGIEANKIIIDPGFGFGKNLPQNLALLRSLDIFAKLHKPVLVGISNKSMIGQILDVTLEQRVYGNLAASVVAMAKGASIIRAHDVQATSDALKVFKAIAGL